MSQSGSAPVKSKKTCVRDGVLVLPPLLYEEESKRGVTGIKSKSHSIWVAFSRLSPVF